MLKTCLIVPKWFTNTLWLRPITNQIQVIATSVPTVFTESRFDPKLDLFKCSPQTKQLFGLAPQYVEPADFKFTLPNRGLPEFAFVGRSNAGKSTLINSLLGSKKLVRTSKEAGCTKSINYFAFCRAKGINTNSHAAYLVDLPGYGFAKKSNAEQVQWMHIIDSYFEFRDPTVLRRVFVLIDSRRGMMDSDLDMLHTLNSAGLPYQACHSTQF
jgi:ribosome biogenesis GTP-binding protein YsxC/EngB